MLCRTLCAAHAQLSELFQHMHDLDEGDLPPPELGDQLSLPVTAAHQASIGPSTATNPLMTLEFQMKAVHAEKVRGSGAGLLVNLPFPATV